MTAPAERMKALRARRRSRGLREVRFVLPDARARSVWERIADQVSRLSDSDESDALDWIEAVSEFDEPDAAART